MEKCLSQKFVESNLDSEIPIIDNSIDISDYNKDKNIILYDYQVQAIENTCRFLIKYFSTEKNDILEFFDKKLTDEQKDKINVKSTDSNFDLLKDYYIIENNMIGFSNFINRVGFWMATGSGKTLVMIKLVEIIHLYIKTNKIPNKNIMLIIPDSTLLKQIEKQIDIFNQYSGRSFSIVLKNLKSYESDIARGEGTFSYNEIKIYYVLINHISDENKENLINYKRFINQNGWYIICDEAHKGDSKESMRKQYINILSKNGFLFNFSATFTDVIDVITTIFNFKLDEFIKAGYGKNIKVLDDEFSNFRNKNLKKEDFKDEEKENIIIKSFIIYTVTKITNEDLKKYLLEKNIELLYHNPLMITISNEINTKAADMKLYFKCMANIARGAEKNRIDKLKNEMINKLKENLVYSIGCEELTSKLIDKIRSINYSDILKYTFKSESPGEIEVSEIGGNKNELAFRLKTSTSATPFALLKASDVDKWKNDILSEYLFTNDTVSDREGHFNTIHENYNEINILMGSKQFIEGWDSNRPNVINFINMGICEENIKLVLQAIGRGIRIEPYEACKMRFSKSPKYQEIDYNIKNNIKDYINIMESLFIFATNKEVMKNILNKLKIENWHKVNGIKKTKINKKLYVPIYKVVDSQNIPYMISRNEYDITKKFIDTTSTKLLLVRDNLELGVINRINNKNMIVIKDDIKMKDSNPINILNRIDSHFKRKRKILDGFQADERIEIEHYKNIQINLGEDFDCIDELENLEKGITMIFNEKNKKYNENQSTILKLFKNIPPKEIEDDKTMQSLIENSNLTIKEVIEYSTEEKIKDEIRDNYNIDLKNISHHYYNPIILSQDNSKYRYIIRNESEIQFLENLDLYLSKNKLEWDWWFFSRIQENYDNIYIPYFDSKTQKYRLFYPDFIFWMKKDNKYYIKFIDPKGLEFEQNSRDKLKGFEEIFNENKYTIDGLEFKVELLYYNGSNKDDELINRHKFYNESFSKLFQ